MPYFKRKTFKTEANQVTAETIGDVYNWINSANGGATASSLTSNSFVFSYNDRPITVEIGMWVVDFHNDQGRYVIVPEDAFLQRFEQITDEEAASYQFRSAIPTVAG